MTHSSADDDKAGPDDHRRRIPLTVPTFDELVIPPAPATQVALMLMIRSGSRQPPSPPRAEMFHWAATPVSTG